MQFPALSAAHSETEQRGRFRITLSLEGGEGGRVPLDRLGALALHRVQLHRSYYAVLLRGDAW